MSRPLALVLTIGLLALPQTVVAQDAVLDLRGTWSHASTANNGHEFPVYEWSITQHDATTGEFHGEFRADGKILSTMSGTLSGTQAQIRVDHVREGSSWSEFEGILDTSAELPVISGTYVVSGKTGDPGQTGTFEMRMTAPAEAIADEPFPTSAALPDLLGDWLLTASPAIPGVGSTETWEIYVYDLETSTFAARVGEYEAETALWTATATGDRLVGSVDRRTIMSGWDEMEARVVTEPSLAIVGTYVPHRDLEAGTPGTFEMRPLGKAGPAEPDGASDDATMPAAESTAAPEVESTAAPEVIDASAAPCDASRLVLAADAFAAATPYTSTLVMHGYAGRADELSFQLLVSERVSDPLTWERTTAIPDEDGWSIFETRRIGDQVWQRIDAGEWSVEAPEEGALGMPWPLDVLSTELLPGGLTAEPAVITGVIGGDCVISQLFRTEDGTGKGRVARLTFHADEVLPRTIEFITTRAPADRVRKGGKALRPGNLDSLLMRIEPGEVDPIVPPDPEG